MIDAQGPRGAAGWPEKLMLYIENENNGGGAVASVNGGASEQEISTKTEKQIPAVSASRQISLRLETGSNSILCRFIARVFFVTSHADRVGSDKPESLPPIPSVGKKTPIFSSSHYNT